MVQHRLWPAGEQHTQTHTAVCSLTPSVLDSVVTSCSTVNTVNLRSTSHRFSTRWRTRKSPPHFISYQNSFGFYFLLTCLLIYACFKTHFHAFTHVCNLKCLHVWSVLLKWICFATRLNLCHEARGGNLSAKTWHLICTSCGLIVALFCL